MVEAHSDRADLQIPSLTPHERSGPRSPSARQRVNWRRPSKQSAENVQMSEDDLFPMECPRCHYVATWFPRQAGFATALGMYTKCHELTERLDLSPEDRERY